VSLPDCRTLTVDVRHAAAEKVRTAADFALPELTYFNSSPCPQHTSIAEGAAQLPPCRRCGVRLRRHQRVGVAWLYLRGKGLIADQVGTGKTCQAAALIAAITQAGEVHPGRRVLVVCRASATGQWQRELRRFLPELCVVAATGSASHRRCVYDEPWQVLVTSPQVLINDLDTQRRFALALLVVDDVDPLRNRGTRTAWAIKRLAVGAQRVVELTATPLQKKLIELHSVLEPIGGAEIFGTQTAFRARYLREDLVKVYNPRIGREVATRQFVGHKNLDEFVAKVAPLVLRRSAEQIDDVDLPVIQPHTVYLDLHPAQRARYAELRAGVLRVIKRDGARVKRAEAAAKFLHGAQICAGLVTLGEPDGPGTSVKLDWIMDKLDGDLAQEKVVIFAQFTDTVAALSTRLAAAGIGHVTYWGRQSNPTARAHAQDRFWDDAACRVLIGTTAIEQSLNLQCARHLINVDQIINAARMQQLAGRIRRDGSAYRSVYVTSLLARATQEEGYLDVLRREQALADFVWGEANQLYEALTPLALLHLIGTSGGTG
jgi:SNF2 family DNA or RNA helicase